MLEVSLSHWERQNWVLLYRCQLKSRRRLRRLWKLKLNLLRLGCFLVYVLLRQVKDFARAMLVTETLMQQNQRLSVGLENPSWALDGPEWSPENRR